MGILFDILAAPLVGPIKGMKWIAEKVDDVVKQTTSNKEKLKSDLLELSMKLELGKITEAEFATEEKEILAEMDKIDKSDIKNQNAK